MKAFLILEDGTVFTGTHIGADREVISEIVFNTSMAGYLEVLTDPSYAGQTVCMTYPLIGNYGVCREDMESKRAWTDGFIVRELSRTASNFRKEITIQEFLAEQNIPGIAGIDTRALTKILREKGTMNGMITTDENYNPALILPQLKQYTTGKVVEKVTCSHKYHFELKEQSLQEPLSQRGKKVALLDFGAKDLKSGRVYISSQNHGYVVDTEKLDPAVAVPAFINVNDGTNEGLSYTGKNIFTVQFHPEASPGPHDSGYLFDRFIEMMR